MKVGSILIFIFNQLTAALPICYEMMCQYCFVSTVFKIKGYYTEARSLQEMLIKATTDPIMSSVLKEHFEEDNSFDMIV